jgi:hypothetical protein
MAEAYSRILTREEAMVAHDRFVRHSCLTEAIRRYPDFRFTAADGRSFCLAIDGESIGHRILALRNGLLSRADWEGLCEIVAVIVESADDPSDPGAPSEFEPLLYSDAYEAFEAWRDLHTASGVHLDDDTAQRLAEDLGVPELLDDEEED